MRLGPDGWLYVTQVFGSQITAINPATGEKKIISPRGGAIVSPDDLAFDSKRVEICGNLAYDSGAYRETLALRASGKQQHSTGSYLTVYRRSKTGAWLIVEQSWTGTVQ